MTLIFKPNKICLLYAIKLFVQWITIPTWISYRVNSDRSPPFVWQIDRNIISTKPFLELQATIPNTNENKSDFDYMSKFITNPPHLLVIHLRIPPFLTGKRQTRVIMALFQNFHALCSVSQMNYRKSMKSKLLNIFQWLKILLFFLNPKFLFQTATFFQISRLFVFFKLWMHVLSHINSLRFHKLCLISWCLVSLYRILIGPMI